MSGEIFIYNGGYFSFPQEMKIVSYLSENKIPAKIQEIIDNYSIVYKINNKLTLSLLALISIEINEMINIHNFSDRKYFIKRFIYFNVLPKIVGLELKEFINAFLTKSNENEDLSIFQNDFNTIFEICNHLSKVDFSKNFAHLDKYLLNIEFRNEMFPNYKKNFKKLSYWLNKYEKSNNRILVEELLKSEVRHESLCKYLNENKYTITSQELVNEHILRLKNYILVATNSKQDLKKGGFLINNPIPRGKKIKLVMYGKIFQSHLELILKIDDILDIYSNYLNSSEQSIDKIKKLIIDLENLSYLINLDYETEREKRYELIFKHLMTLIDTNVKTHKYWIIHELLQSIALEKSKSVGLTPTKDGYTDKNKKILSSVYSMRDDEIEYRYLKIKKGKKK